MLMLKERRLLTVDEERKMSTGNVDEERKMSTDDVDEERKMSTDC